MQTCSVPGCDRRHCRAKGLCWAHYQRQRRTGDVQADIPVRPGRHAAGPCIVDGCDRRGNHYGLCSAHYQRNKRTGEVSADIPIGAKGWTWAQTRGVILRENARIPPPSAALEPHYRPWSCPPSADTTTLIAEGRVWRGEAHAEIIMGIHEARDLGRDRRDREAGWRWTGQEWLLESPQSTETGANP